MVRDRVFVVPLLNFCVYQMYKLIWERSESDFRRVRRTRIKYIKFNKVGYERLLFASHGSVLLIADNGKVQSYPNHNNHHQQTWLLDRSTKRTFLLPPLTYPSFGNNYDVRGIKPVAGPVEKPEGSVRM